jgi:hypothetical protein
MTTSTSKQQGMCCSYRGDIVVVDLYPSVHGVV